MNLRNIVRSNKGAALLLALMMTTIIVLLIMFVTAMGSGQLRMAGESSDSSRAFAAADAGIEYALSRISLKLPVGQDAASCACGSGVWCPGAEFDSKAQYCVTADNPSQPRKITAVGRTTDTSVRRSIEILVPVYAAMNGISTTCYMGDNSSHSLDWICQQSSVPGGPYTGATGLFSNPGAVSCAGIPAAPILGIRPSAQSFTLSNANAFVVQCYR